MAVKVITDDSFDTEVLESEKAVLVDFWADHCGPCHQIAPVLEELSGEYQDRLTVVKVNIDDNPEAPTKYGVRSIPTLMIFQGGEPVAIKIGAVPKSSFASWIDGTLNT